MKIPRKAHAFNIIEIALTLAIIGFAMASIMAIFPMGFAVTRDTMAQNYASDIGDQVLGHIQRMAGDNWDTTFTAGNWNPARQSPPLPSGSWTPIVINASLDAKLESDSSNTFRYFRISRSTLVDTNRVTEMTAIAQLWCNDLTTTDPYRTVYVEVSWPETAPYAERKTLTLCKQIFKPN